MAGFYSDPNVFRFGDDPRSVRSGLGGISYAHYWELVGDGHEVVGTATTLNVIGRHNTSPTRTANQIARRIGKYDEIITKPDGSVDITFNGRFSGKGSTCFDLIGLLARKGMISEGHRKAMADQFRIIL